MRSTTQTPLVSVIIPVFNGAAFVARAIQSVLDQSMPDFELIVVDDGSVDETSAVVRAFTDRRLSLVVQANGGPSAARNNGIQRSRAKWVAILDADDYWAPTKLEAQLARADATPSAALIYTAAQYCSPDGNAISEVPATIEENIHAALIQKNHIVASSAMIRRDVLERVGLFHPELSGCEDWDLWLRIAEVADVAAVPEPLVSVVTRPDSLSSDATRMRNIGLRVINRVVERNPGLTPATRRRAYWACHYAAAIAYQSQGFVPLALRSLARSVAFRPTFAPGYWRAVRILSGRPQ